MKRIWLTMTLTLALALLLSVPALAQTTGVEFNGKTYVFHGENGTYQADGITFLIEDDQVTIQVPGEPDVVLPLADCADESVAEDVVSGCYVFSCEVVENDGGVAFSVIESADGAVEVFTGTPDEVSTWIEDALSAEDFAAYAPYGLSFDADEDALYYQGKRVRVFEDLYDADAESILSVQHLDDEGVIDVEVLRGTGNGILSLRVLSDAEFAARDFSAWNQPSIATYANEGAEWSPMEKAEFFAPYAAFGLKYDAKTDALTYEGMAVRRFLDVRMSNGEDFSSGKFEGEMTQICSDEGEIDVETIRDFTQPDENGEGKLIGMRVAAVR